MSERAHRRDLLVLLVVLQLADVLTTWKGLTGEHEEANPVGVVLLSAGVWGLLFGKAVATAAVALITAWVAGKGERGERLAIMGLRWSVWMMLAVVGWNSWRIGSMVV